MARPKKNTVQLSDIDVKKLKGILQKADTCQTIVNRCRILLALDENHPPVRYSFGKNCPFGRMNATTGKLL